MHDLVIADALIVNGTLATPVVGDVAISAGIIQAVGTITGGARRRISAAGAAVAPGFIDLHTHVDFTIHRQPDAPSMIRQGVTTLVTGNCGFAPFPVLPADRAAVAGWMGFLSADEGLLFRTARETFAALGALPLVPNVVQLAGHGTLRWAVMGPSSDHPGPGRSERMASELASAMADGAVGLSSGLIYDPGAFAQAPELTNLGTVLSRLGGWYATHIRGEGRTLLSAVREAISVGRDAGIPVHISHLKAAGPAAWGTAHGAIALIEAARQDGLDVTADQYPYTATSTKLASLLSDGLAGPDLQPDAVLLYGVDGEMPGRSLAEVAARRRLDVPRLVSDLCATQGDTIQIIRVDRMSEDDVDEILRAPFVSVASDGWSLTESVGANRHPRSFGTFVRVLGRYVRERRLLDLASAVHKMTALPATRLGLHDRGAIRAGAIADLVVFDPMTVGERATYDRPYRFASGVHHVLVAGIGVIEDGQPTGAAPGSVLRRDATTQRWTSIQAR